MNDLTPRWPRWVLGALVTTLLLPLLATLLYSLSTRWGATLLPDGFTLEWYLQLWGDPRFLAAFGRLVVAYYFPKLDPWMNLLILLPFAVPPVVSSVGLLQIYADGPLPIVGTPWILVGTWFTVVLPFMYRALANSLQGVPLRDLMDAAHLLGASSARAFAMVVLPNLRKGLLAALFLSLSFLLGEFVFANMLVGTRYETLQVYLYNMRATSGHFTSALVMSYFLLTLLLTWAANRFHR
ncbi:ABC transporter permease subunit [Aeromonas sp.]|uniref:ABC transporter permease n=1 Tax=Aeromonas sp. TaxID=647 RepID=UPI0025844D6A|nr:ABC transporter permease subunit [Aeromonas sp.]MCX7133643.1 ABC transporter permease subunit [Aeromonas sp.]